MKAQKVLNEYMASQCQSMKDGDEKCHGHREVTDHHPVRLVT